MSQRFSKTFLNDLFLTVDANNDGYLSFEEAKEFLPRIQKQLKLQPNKLIEYFNLIDLNKDNKINFEEFHQAVLNQLKNALNTKSGL